MFRNPPLLVDRGSELFDLVVHMHGLGSFDRELEQAEQATLGDVGVAVLPLARIIESKRATDRAKDRAILPILEDTLRVVNSRRKHDLDSGTKSE
jgi:hypothetical protein